MVASEIIKNLLHLKSLPTFCTYLVTWRCNARCQMCDIWKKDKGDELTLAEIENIFRQLKLDAIRITGGEPFLREDLAEIVNTIQQYSRPKLIHITSNGLLTDRIVSFIGRCKKTKNLHIKISIDAIGAKHDQIRGTPGAYTRAMDTLMKLIELRKDCQFYLGVDQTIIDEQGLEDYKKLTDILRPFNVQVHPVIAYVETALYANQENINLLPKNATDYKCFFHFSPEKMTELLSFLKKEANALANLKERLVKKYYLKGLYNRLILNKAKPNPPCLALKNHLRILPNGEVPICLFNSQIVGDLKKTSIEDLWFSKEIKKYRSLVEKCPGCWAGCEVTPNAIYSGDIIKGLF